MISIIVGFAIIAMFAGIFWLAHRSMTFNKIVVGGVLLVGLFLFARAIGTAVLS